MSYTNPQRAPSETAGAKPTLLLSAVSLLLIVALLALLAPDVMRPDPLAKDAAQSAAPTPDTPIVPTQAPAISVVRAVVDADPVWAAAVPLPFGCQGPAPVVSAVGSHGAVLIGAFVMPAGGGRQAMDSLRSCGHQRTVAGAQARSFSVDGGQVVIWSRGDVLVSVSAPAVDAAVLAATDTRLLGALEGQCASADIAAQDPTRNPTLGQYTPWRIEQQVAVVASGLEVPEAESVATPTELDAPTLPAGVTGPPLPEAVPAPQRPEHPGEQPLTRSYWLPAVDELGPGCGWAFTGATGPQVDPAAVSRQAAAATRDAQTALDAEHAEWAQAATSYLDALPGYQEQLSAWEAYATEVREVAAHWQDQAKSLATYQAAVTTRQTQLDQLASFEADRDAAQKTYEAAVLACTTWQQEVETEQRAPRPDPESTPTPEPDADPSATPPPGPTPAPPEPPLGGCPAPRSAILDQAAPAVAPEPTPPMLWEPES
ncbi:hypothetical protein [Pseudactinotalea terrae]|uniref:hypothetical protein n=1 Tax=Pseudactinotalea terrae TaxID=1743262 RepID=UPI0012E25808|nr:hypothetical protein [Pseudactinotalea terrae]